MVQRSRTIGLVVHDGANLLEISGPLQVFATATEQLEEMGLHRSAYRVLLVSTRGGAVTTSVGVSLRTAAVSGLSTRFDTVMVAGASPTPGGNETSNLADWVGNSASKRQRTAAIGNGCLVLAAAGLIDGRRVAARGSLSARLYRDWPGICVEAGEAVVRDGPIWTSAGASSAMDLALAMIEADWGRRIALRVARSLALDPARLGKCSNSAAKSPASATSHRCAEPAY